MPSPISIPASLQPITQPWTPSTLTTLNSTHDIKVAKIIGQFIWHAHPNTDELFLVLEGDMVLELIETPSKITSAIKADDREVSGVVGEGGEEIIVTSVVLNKGDIFVVRKGVRHRPIAGEGGASILMMEERGTEALGDAGDEERKVAEGLRRDGVGKV